MSMKRVFSMLAALSLAIGAGFASLPAQAKPPAQIAGTAAPALGSGLPVVVPGPNLIQARYYRYHYHRYWRRHYYYHRYYHRWHYRHYYHRHWRYRHYYRY
jgi:hypothetical protein